MIVDHRSMQYIDFACNRKKHITGACDIVEERCGILLTTQRKRAEHKVCHDGCPATSVR